MKKIIAVILMLLLIGSFTSCDVLNKKEEKTPSYPVKVANITVEKQPKKVACLSPSLVEILFEQGYGDKVVIRTDDADYPEAAKLLPSAGKTGHLNVSAILSALPDVLLTHESLSKKEMDALESAQIQVVVLPMAKTLAELKKMYENIGLLLLGQNEGGKSGDGYYAKIESGLQEIKEKLPAQAADNSFLYLIHPSGIVATGDTFESSILSVFGKNVAQDATGYTADAKEMQAKNPSVILVADPYGLPHLQASTLYKNFGAVKNNAVYTIDNALFARQSSRILELVRKIAATLYPDVFTEPEASDETGSSQESVSSGSGKQTPSH